MTRLLYFLGLILLFVGCNAAAESDDGWISLFDGESLDGWQANENPETFSVRDGMIVVDGPRSHLFYVGPVENADFTNFEFRADVMTEPGANSGIYFHTQYLESGWPAHGYEAQVNNTHSDWRKTGSLYAVDDVTEGVPDNEWWTQYIRVQGNNIVIQINDSTVVDYTEPEEFEDPETTRRLSSGTFALQGHDPESVIYYRNIMVRPLD